MTKLERQHLRVFGIDAKSGELGIIGSKAQGTGISIESGDEGDVQVLQSLNDENGRNYFEQGYFHITDNKDGTSLPSSQELNSLFYILTYQAAYGFQSGIPEWNDSTEYFAYASYVQSGGNLYLAIKGSEENRNIGFDPTLREYWSAPFNIEIVLSQIELLKKNGIFLRTAETSYSLNSVVHQDGKLYRSTMDGNTGNSPSISSDWVNIVD